MFTGAGCGGDSMPLLRGRSPASGLGSEGPSVMGMESGAGPGAQGPACLTTPGYLCEKPVT